MMSVSSRPEDHLACGGNEQNYVAIEPQPTFIEKATRVLEVLKGQIPECCRHHVIPLRAHG